MKEHEHHQKNHIHRSKNLAHENKRKMENKKFLWTIILVFALIIVALIFIFLPQVKEEQEKSKPQPVNEQCAFLCDTEQKDGFCFFKVSVGENLKATCNDLATNSQYSNYNVQSCNKFSCEQTAQEQDKTCVTGLGGEWKTPTSENSCPQKDGFFSRKRTASDSAPISGQICCFYYQ